MILEFKHPGYNFPAAITDDEHGTMLEAINAGGFDERRRLMLITMNRDSENLREVYKQSPKVFREMLDTLTELEQHVEAEHEMTKDALVRMMAVMEPADKEALFRGE